MQNIENGVNFSQFMKDAKVIYGYTYRRFHLFFQRIPLRGQEAMSEAQIQSFERAGYKMSGFNKRQTEANYMKAERKVYTQEHFRYYFLSRFDFERFQNRLSNMRKGRETYA